MRKEWVLLVEFLQFLQFLELPPGAGGSTSLPGWGCSTPGQTLGANPANPGQGSTGRTGMKGLLPPAPGTKMGFELFEVHSHERYFEFSPHKKRLETLGALRV